LRTASGEEFTGVFQDLTIRGASAKFLINHGQLVVGQAVLLMIGALTRTTGVHAAARVVFCVDAPGGRLCGFQFTDPAAIAPQLDSFYGRYFNRRRALRVSMPLGRKIAVHLFASGDEFQAELLDLSTDGMLVRAPRASAKELDEQNHTFVRLTLPGQKTQIQGRAAILRRTHERGLTTLGLSFDLLAENGFASHRAALQSWVDRRAEEIAKWDRSLSKPEPFKPPPNPNAA
jgi:c-di-GMP-binding flagellar brake protein YcgR